MKPVPLFTRTVQEFERSYLLKELTDRSWNRFQTAKALGLSYRGILYKIEKFGLTAPNTSAADGGPGPGRDSLRATAS